MTPVAIYVHVPFCPSKCGYCDFNSYVMDADIRERTTQATVAEVLASPHSGRPAKTIFFGGGTPTQLEPFQLKQILKAVTDTHPPAAGIEVTSEANPGSVDAEKFQAMRLMGFNRISLGAQSFQQGDLFRLGRVHEASDVAKAVLLARKAGFSNINLDLMFGLPGQSERGWRTNLEIATSLAPDHLSLYGLTIEPETRFYRHHMRGTLELPDEESVVNMYDAAVDHCEKNGMRQYEISNFAKPGHECHHNLCYWRAEEYVGYGPGAVGRIGPVRYTNIKHPARYAEAVETGATLWCAHEELNPRELEFERTMLGIRLNEGLIPGPQVSPETLFGLAAKGWAKCNDGQVALTRSGRHFCSAVALELV
ncbi:MAG: radical SAM family heme chaperone HemW [Chthonomonadaceae bacterium]|nr:radical SAM family heme chaperone HemW [Chthonomonadaceae bacterium]